MGGGTPTYHEPEELRRVLAHILGAFHPTKDAELAVEVDPRVTRIEHLDVLAEFGFNRISMGVQDFTPRVQQAIGRVQSEEATRTLVEAARERGFKGINIDLIYGLPHQQLESFARTVDAVIGMEADRCAVYSFAFVPWIRGHQKKLIEADLPSRETKFSLFARAREQFLAAGYRAIGMDHFARPDDELAIAREEGRLRRNFQGYTVIPASDVIGVGISAIGDVKGLHVQNEKKLSRYQAAIEAGRLPVERGVARTEDDEIRREVIHELMCNGRVDFARVEERFGIRFDEYFARDLAELQEHADTGMVTISADTIEATPLGELFIRNLARCFDRYWREKHADGDSPVFSRTV
ncbi:MAG: oxygen-independent coproporphyrinogen III oxidase [Acidobacteriota bacterium]|nr:oxygen-independent coproporphyrinogen III oxidase [Acidobacteriota bacterium]